jgi:hypothetical protein
MATATAWEGDKFVWSGDLNSFMGQAKVPYRLTFIKNGLGARFGHDCKT